jgi:hypothetical protein
MKRLVHKGFTGLPEIKRGSKKPRWLFPFDHPIKISPATKAGNVPPDCGWAAQGIGKEESCRLICRNDFFPQIFQSLQHCLLVFLKTFHVWSYIYWRPITRSGIGGKFQIFIILPCFVYSFTLCIGSLASTSENAFSYFAVGLIEKMEQGKFLRGIKSQLVYDGKRIGASGVSCGFSLRAQAPPISQQSCSQPASNGQSNFGWGHKTK